MAYTFQLDISYTQFVVCEANMINPFNEWTHGQYNQGFSWRKGSVSFGTFHSGLCNITVEARRTWQDNSRATRIIVVPFEVPEDGIEIISTESKLFDIPPGKYELYFSAIRGEAEGDIDSYEIYFVPNSNPVGKILRQDDELNPPTCLLMDARPAQ